MAPPSWRAWWKAAPAAWSAWLATKLPLPSTPNASRTPSAASVRPTVVAASTRAGYRGGMASTAAPAKLDPSDVLGLDHLLGDEERMLRDSVRRWVGDRILPEIGSWYEEGIFPRELAKEVGDLGLLGMK